MYFSGLGMSWAAGVDLSSCRNVWLTRQNQIKPGWQRDTKGTKGGCDQTRRLHGMFCAFSVVAARSHVCCNATFWTLFDCWFSASVWQRICDLWPPNVSEQVAKHERPGERNRFHAWSIIGSTLRKFLPRQKLMKDWISWNFSQHVPNMFPIPSSPTVRTSFSRDLNRWTWMIELGTQLYCWQSQENLD